MLKYEEFLKLPREEQNRRIYELSDRDRLRARMQDSEIGAKAVKRSMAPEDIEKNRRFMEELEKALEAGTMNLIK